MARVFISYGHDRFARFAQRLKDDLATDFGHDTWFDVDRLRPGGDWERYIVRADRTLTTRAD